MKKTFSIVFVSCCNEPISSIFLAENIAVRDVPILAEPGLEKWVIECSDRFGSYGVVGFGLVSRRPEEVWIEDFMLSCRVQGRFVERALFHALVASDPSVSRIGVNFTSTRGNTPARQVLLAMGFEEVDSENYMYLDLRRHDVTCDFIELKGGPSIVHRQSLPLCCTRVAIRSPL